VVTVRLVQEEPQDLGVISGASVLVVLLALARGQTVRDRVPRRAERRALVRLTAAFVIFAMLPLALLAAASIRLSERAVENDARARVRTTSTVSAELVSQQMEGLGQLVAAYAERQLLMTALGDGTPQTFEDSDVQRHLTQLQAANPGISGVFVTDTAGVLKAVRPSTPAIVGKDFSFRDWYVGAMRTDGPYVSEAYTTAISGEARVVAAASVVRQPETGRVVGILAALYDLKAIQAFADELADVQGVSLRITDQRGTVVAAPGAVGNKLVDAGSDAGVAAALRGEEGIGTAVEPTGEEVLSAYAPVPALGWTVTARVPTATAYASLGPLRSTVLAITVLLGQILLGGLVLMAHAQRERRGAERALATARDEAVEASRAKTEFLAVMSHELRTPMNGVMGMTSLLLATALSDQQRDYAETVRTSAESLLMLLNDVLDLSKVEADRLELEVIDFDLHPVVRDVVHLLEPVARGQGVSLTAEVGDDVRLALRGDPARLRQVLINLVGNAVKFTPSGSVLLRVLAHTATDVGASVGESVTLRFEVTDTGIGIPAGARDQLFEAFSQADSSTTRRYGGTGLGLAISKSLVALFGGEIGVDSEVGVGSTFWFTATFQAGAPVEGSPEPTSAPGSRPARPGLVLVVDDNDTNRTIAVRMLETLGHRADVAADGTEAIRAHARVAYDLILMDCRMPLMDGYEATRTIRAAEGAGRRTPIVAMTASAMVIDRQRCRDAGMDDYLSKPVRLEDVAGTVNRWLPEGDSPVPDSPVLESPVLESPVLDSPVLDEAVVDGLRSLGPDFLARLVPIFVLAAPAGLADVRSAVMAGDTAALSAAAHALRGSAANMGGLQVAAVCGRLEESARGGRLDGAEADLLILETELTRLVVAVSALVAVPA
jgi:signal transduction histidine kinase/ActR/RegA family two-component response regulator/HPt (histidine-containing phosphotransfer) domain-containing protein